jgi:hypothetical protein
LPPVEYGCRFKDDLGKIWVYIRQHDRKALEAAWQELTMKGLCRELPDVEVFVMDAYGSDPYYWQIRIPGDRRMVGPKVHAGGSRQRPG